MPDLDVVIFGGGIAGLWTLARLSARGYACVLVTEPGGRCVVGGRQTLASQGIIHGGVKYALGGAASRASRAIAAMPELWGACLRGEAPAPEPDLRGAAVLSPRQHLWTTGTLGSRLVALAASKAIRTPVRRLDEAERAAWVRASGGGDGATNAVDVYEVAEPVLEPRSVIEALVGPRRGLIGACSDAARVGDAFEVTVGEGGLRFSARAAVLCAGEGNEALIGRLVESAPAGPTQQTRPLHMVYVRGALPTVFGHALAGLTSADKPRVTITTQRDRASGGGGGTVWNVGGLVAETGIERARGDQIEHAKRELAACLPWASPEGAQFATRTWRRAEGATPGGRRPDEPVVTAMGRTIAAWPTKLAFAPEMARRVEEALVRAGVEASGRSASTTGLAGFGAPEVDELPWESPSLEWSS